ncbi:MAG: ATP-binding protein [Gammaproteobacteria bacterium]|jgi:signal transduction histidine kinase
MTSVGSKKFFIVGFIGIIVLLIALIILWHNNIRTSTERLKRLAGSQLETSLLTTMRDATHRRAISLARMNAMDDPFDRDEEFIKIREMGTLFLQARNKLWERPMTPEEDKAWEVVKENMNKGGMIQHRVLNLIQDENLDDAKKVFIKELVPMQDRFVDNISSILEMKRAEVEQELQEASRNNKQAYGFIGLMGSVAIMLGIFMVVVIRRTGKTEDALLEQSDRIRALYEVSSMSGLKTDEQIEEMLNLGCRFLKMDCGRVNRVEKDKNTSTVLNVAGPDTYNQNPGMMYFLDESICSITVDNNGPLAINDLKDPTIRGHHKSLRNANIESYIAAPITVNGKTYGTVNFSSRTKRMTPFAETDKDMVNLIGSWVSVAIERQIQQQELRAAKDSAESANKTKSAFLANMSHELRTPLNAIIGYSEMLSEEASVSKDEDSLEDLEKIKMSGHHLLTLINDVLDLSKIEAGRMEFVFEDFDIEPVINEISATILPSVGKNNNQLEVNLDLPDGKKIHADKMRFKQVLFNLLSNANKFTQHGTITINVHAALQQDAEFLSIEVKDTGIGMTPDQMSRVFEAFTQADPSISKEYGGTGLGLAISQRICMLMEGEITVDSVEGVGSSFTVLLPAAESNRSAAVA